MIKNYTYFLGLDVGVNNGWALWNKPEQRFIEIKTLKLYEVFDKLKKLMELVTDKEESFLVRIENPNTWRPFKGVQQKAHDSLLQGAGSVKRSYSAIVEFLEDYYIKYEPVRIQGALKKLNSEKFSQMTGWKERTSNHGRDAACLVWKI